MFKKIDQENSENSLKVVFKGVLTNYTHSRACGYLYDENGALVYVGA